MTTLVLGAGVSGQAAARSARDQGQSVRCYDERADAALPSDLGSVEMITGVWSDSYADGIDLAVVSPGFPPTSASILALRRLGVRLVAEAQFGIDQMSGKLVAVTGTNGKSTVTQATSDMLEASGVRSVAAGNIGRPLSEIATADQDLEVIVAELSSFQLELMSIHPVGATILNLAPDHLDWHGTFESYAEAKASVLDEMSGDDLFVGNADDEAVVAIAKRAACRVVAASGVRVPTGGNGVEGDTLVIGDHRYTAPIDDPSYRFDLVVAASLALSAGATPDGIGQTIESFQPGKHRRNLVATINGVRWINDSKGTNPHAAVAAATAYDRVRLLAGGRNKNLDLSPIGAMDRLTKLYAFGEAGPEIARDAVVPVSIHESMEGAIREAADDAQPGDVVLLSPGCTSFDEFTSYAERGERFAEVVRVIQGGDRP